MCGSGEGNIASAFLQCSRAMAEQGVWCGGGEWGIAGEVLWCC